MINLIRESKPCILVGSICANRIAVGFKIGLLTAETGILAVLTRAGGNGCLNVVSAVVTVVTGVSLSACCSIGGHIRCGALPGSMSSIFL